MIIGFGSDLCSIERIQKSLDRFGQRFIDRVFTPVEQPKANRRELTRAGTYAKRFAAKEACSKALGTEFRAGVYFRELGLVNDHSGNTTLRLNGGAAARLRTNTPPGQPAVIQPPLSRDPPLTLP